MMLGGSKETYILIFNKSPQIWDWIWKETQRGFKEWKGFKETSEYYETVGRIDYNPESYLNTFWDKDVVESLKSSHSDKLISQKEGKVSN